jgi:transposase-like protein
VSGERRAELLAAFAQSGLTRTEFARREGIKYTTLCNWVQQEGKAGEPVKALRAVRFAEVALGAGVARELEVRLSDGTTLRGESVAGLAALARALRS